MSNFPEGQTQEPWATSELSPAEARYIKAQLGRVPNLTGALQQLGDDLEVGSSRTLFCLPGHIVSRTVIDGMLNAAQGAAHVLPRYGVQGITPGRLPFEIREDEVASQLGAERLIDLGQDHPLGAIGYVRIEQQEAGIHASVGALDLQTLTDFSLPL